MHNAQLESTHSPEGSSIDLHAISKNLPYSVIFELSLDKDGKSVMHYVSESVRAVLGLDPVKLKNDPNLLYSLIEPEDFSRFQIEREKSIQKNESVDIDLQLKKTAGVDKWINLRSVPFVKNGIPGRYGIITDITKNKTVISRLLQENLLLKNLFDHTTSIMLLSDNITGQILDANTAAQRFYGYTLDEFQTKQICSLKQIPGTQSQEKPKSTEPVSGESSQTVHYTSSGAAKHIELHNSGFTYQGQQLQYSIIVDVTYQFETAAENQKFLSQLHALANNLPQSVILRSTISANNELNVDFISENCSAVLGIERESIIIHPYFLAERMLPEDAKNYIGQREDALRDNKPLFMEFIYCKSESESIWLRLQSMPLNTDTGDVIWNSILTDITEIKDKEAAAIENEKIFGTLFNTSGLPMLLINAETGMITDANPASLRFYGYDKEYFCQQHITRINKSGNRSVAERVMNLVVKKKINRFSTTHITSSNEEKEVEVEITSLHYNHANLLFEIVYDMTEINRQRRKKEQARLKKQATLTEQTSRYLEVEKEKIGYLLNENINQLLATAKVYLDLQQTDPDAFKEKGANALQSAINMIRSLSESLNPNLAILDFKDVLFNLAARFPGKVVVHYQLPVSITRLPVFRKNLKPLLFRLIEEQVDWIKGHSPESQMSITLNQQKKQIRLIITFPLLPPRLAPKNQESIKIVQNRAEFYGGKLEFQQNADGTNSLLLNLPIVAEKK